MVTPGAAGSATTILTATLSVQFNMTPSTTALVISFLFGALTFVDKTVPFLQRIIFYVINSITIFSVAMGVNYAGMALIEKKEFKPVALERSLQPKEAVAPPQKEPFFHDWFD